MELIPAIDLLGGRVVRLSRGAYDAVTDYGDDPVEVVLRWQDEGASRIHIVDLDAAREGRLTQEAIVSRVVRRDRRALSNRRWYPERSARLAAALARLGPIVSSSAVPSSAIHDSRQRSSRHTVVSASWRRWTFATGRLSATAG